MAVIKGRTMAQQGRRKRARPAEKGYRAWCNRFRHIQSAQKRGTAADPLENLAVIERVLSPGAARALYGASWFARNVVDVISEDMTRKGFVVTTGDEALDELVRDYLVYLEAQSKLHDIIRNDLIYGNGFILIGVNDGAPLSKPIQYEKVRTIKFLNVIDPQSVSRDAVIDNDISSPSYGEIKRYKVGNTEIDASRVIHLAMRALYGEAWGRSIYIPLLQIIRVLDSAEWSAGQIIYSLVTKVIRGNFSGLTDEEERALQGELEQSLNMLTTIMLDRNEEFEYKSPAGVTQGVEALLSFIWECAAGAARIPRTHLIGQQAGAIAGAREDTRTYYNRIAGMQKAYIAPIVLRLVRLVLLAQDGGKKGPAGLEEIPINVTFPPLDERADQEQAEALLNRAKTAQILVDTGILSLEEAKAFMRDRE